MIKAYILVDEYTDPNYGTRQEYLDCFFDTDELIKYINELNLEEGHKIQVIMKCKEMLIEQKSVQSINTVISPHTLHTCTSFDECTNPLRDCINCSLRSVTIPTVSYTNTEKVVTK